MLLQTTLADIIPDLGTALSSKNPQVKEGTLKFLGRSLASATSPIQPPQVKPLAETLATLLEDSFEGARNEAANCLGTLMKMVGERPLNAVVEAVTDVRKAKIKEAYEKATVKCKAGGAGPTKAKSVAPPPAAVVKKKSPAPKSVVVEDEPLESPPLKKPSGKPPARLLVCPNVSSKTSRLNSVLGSNAGLQWRSRRCGASSKESPAAYHRKISETAST